MSDRRGWLHMAAHDVEMRDQLRHVPAAMIGVSALDVLDGLIGIIDAQQSLIAGQEEAIRAQDVLGTLLERQEKKKDWEALINEWQAEHGAFTEEELAQAKAELGIIPSADDL